MVKLDWARLTLPLVVLVCLTLLVALGKAPTEMLYAFVTYVLGLVQPSPVKLSVPPPVPPSSQDPK